VGDVLVGGGRRSKSVQGIELWARRLASVRPAGPAPMMAIRGVFDDIVSSYNFIGFGLR
jgi:hypothetical protein